MRDMENRRRNLFLAFIFSVILHILLFLWLKIERWWDIALAEKPDQIPREMVITFPENKPEEPREIVENINENEQLPDQSNLLSDKNSRAANPEKSDQIGDLPKSSGQSPFSNLSRPSESQKTFQSPGFRKFSSRALTGERVDENEIPGNKRPVSEGQQAEASLGTNQNLDQEKFSVDQLGALTLSTYKWSYAPYVNALKRKLERTLNLPPAWHMGLIPSGQSAVLFEITRDGQLKRIKLLDHKGHEALEIASMESIRALFPFLSLPKDFPDETLTIVAKLQYINDRIRR